MHGGWLIPYSGTYRTVMMNSIKNEGRIFDVEHTWYKYTFTLVTRTTIKNKAKPQSTVQKLGCKHFYCKKSQSVQFSWVVGGLDKEKEAEH